LSIVLTGQRTGASGRRSSPPPAPPATSRSQPGEFPAAGGRSVLPAARRRATADGTPQPLRWLGSRVARPARDLDRSVAFYRDLLGLREQGGFRGHDGYDGVFFALPAGGELELTSGPAEPRPGTEEDLLVLYLATVDEVGAVAGELCSAGVVAVPSPNPYWTRWGRTFLDPDGHRVVVAAMDPGTAN
jgi:catechol 2,3-dioxygenase-like lactoylglutathione lyase family enzyme